MRLSKEQKLLAISLVTGQRGGALRGDKRPTCREFDEALRERNWTTEQSASAVFWLGLAGALR